MHNVDLSLAINRSDQVADLLSGEVSIKGVNLFASTYPVEEIFYRFTKFREWDISEMSLGKYSSLIGRGDNSLVGIPVFLSRSFRHSGIFVASDGPVDNPKALTGGRIGIPEWTVTATIYQRALLQHEFGLHLEDVEWVQGGINAAGRIETLPVGLPNGIRIRPEREHSLNELLVRGEIDAMLVPHPPQGFSDGSGSVVQLFTDPKVVEAEYFARTRIFPIMHLVVIRREIHERHPWLAGNLVAAFTEAKDRSIERMLDYTAPHAPIPWGVDAARYAQTVLGSDIWPYGIEPNRATLEGFLGFAHEQGLTPRVLTPEDLFPESVQTTYLI